MSLDLLVLGYGKFKLTTQRCLMSIMTSAKALDIPIYVLDNGSPDDSAALQEEFCKDQTNVHSITSSENLGFAGGMNLLANHSSREWLMLIGSDTVFHPDALQILKDGLASLPDHIGIVGPVTNTAGNAQSIDLLGQDLISAFQEWDRVFSKKTQLIVPLYRADFFCVAIRRSLWNQLQGLDRKYGLGYYEDFDFCMRAQQLGMICAMFEDAFVYHQGSVSFKSNTAQSQLIKKNKKIFCATFPEAQLRHKRLDTYLAIEYMLRQDIPAENLQATQNRIRTRIQSLYLDQPRSFFKKLRWKNKLKKLDQLYASRFNQPIH
jgi:GT2 family glycosyltransferase